MSTAPTLDILTSAERAQAAAAIGADRLLLIPDPFYDDEWRSRESTARISPGYMVVAYSGTMSRHVGDIYDTRSDRARSRRPKTPKYAYRAEGYNPHQRPAFDQDYPDGNPWENDPIETLTVTREG